MNNFEPMEELSINYEKWYNLLSDIEFNCSDQKKDSIILKFLSKLLFVKSLEDFSFLKQDLVKDIWYNSIETKDDPYVATRLHEFLASLDSVIFELINTHLFSNSSNNKIILSYIDIKNVQYNEILKIIQCILGFRTKDENKFGGLFQISIPKETYNVIGTLYENLINKKRKEMGIFYTPNYLARYATEKTIKSKIGEIIQELKFYLKSEDFNCVKLLITNLKTLKIVDPSCGSGIFLINGLREIWTIYQKISEILEGRINYYKSRQKQDKNSTEIKFKIEKIHNIQKFLHLDDNFDCISFILVHHIHGVDIDNSAILITKLNLWLEAVKIIQKPFLECKDSSKKNTKLPNLDLNILKGDAILGCSINQTLSLIKNELRNKILELFKYRNAYLDDPNQEEIIYKIKSLKNSLRDKINPKFINSFKKNINKSDLRYPYKPFHWAIEFWFVFINYDGIKSQNLTNGFDIILGNPPWGADLSVYFEWFKFRFHQIAVQQFDSFQIFLFNTFDELLKKDGFLGFIIPNELCLEEGSINLRKYILNYQILEINNLGLNIFENVNRPSMFLLIKKSTSSENHLININSNLSKKDISNQRFEECFSENMESDLNFTREQISFSRNEKFRFDIFATNLDMEIKNIIKAKGFRPLKVYFSNGRGIDTNKKGRHLLCPICGYLNPPFGVGNALLSMKNCINDECKFKFKKDEIETYESEDIILDKDFFEGEYQAPGYIGEDVHRFYFSRNPRLIKFYGNLFFTPKKNSDLHTNSIYTNISEERKKYTKYSKVRWKNPNLYRGEKLLLRKVSSNSLFQIMVTDDFLVTNQQIYIFKKKKGISEVSIYFYLAILASRLIFYYYITEFGDPEKEIMPHFTQTKIKSIPIPYPDITDEKYRRLIVNTKSLINYIEKYKISNEKIQKKSLRQKIEECFDSIDTLVFQYYGISDSGFKLRIISFADENGFRIF